VAASDDGDMWVEWLDHYVHHCRTHMRTRELDELASALSSGVNTPDWLGRAVSARTAEGGRLLVGFLAGIESSGLRDSLALEAVNRLRWGHASWARSVTEVATRL
jgi:hypothetical protein